jgi:hypothetical protein
MDLTPQAGKGQEMSEETNKTSATEETGSATTETTDKFAAITSQEELDRVINLRLKREREKYQNYDEYKTAAGKLAEIEASNKSELEKLQDSNAQLAAKLKAFEEKEQIAAWVQEVAEATGIPAKALRGTTKEELEAHAETLKEVYKPPNPAPVVHGIGKGGKTAASTTAQQFEAAVEGIL